MILSRRATLFRKTRFSNLRLLTSTAGADTIEIPESLGDTSRPLYEGHEPTSILQRGLLTVGSAFMALRDPTRSDMVSVFGEITGYPALRSLHRQMISDPVGSQILRERPFISTKTVDMDHLRSLPDGTFGKEYARFMDTCEISSDTRDPVRFVDHEELAYVMLRYRQIHDFTHLLTGFPSIAVPAEIAVKWFEMVHYGLPLCVFAATVAPVILSSSEREVLRNEVIPWALYSGYRAKLFLNIYFEKHFEQDINEFRREINLIQSPVTL